MHNAQGISECATHTGGTEVPVDKSQCASGMYSGSAEAT